jgi:hypothetical protein
MKKGACIINTASINADTPNPTLLAYATTKGQSKTSLPALPSFSPRMAFAPTRSHLDRSGRL